MSDITANDLKKIVYLTNTNKTTGDITSVVIPHDFAVGFDGLSKNFIVNGKTKLTDRVDIRSSENNSTLRIIEEQDSDRAGNLKFVKMRGEGLPTDWNFVGSLNFYSGFTTSGGTEIASILVKTADATDEGKFYFQTRDGANGISTRLSICQDGRIGVGIASPTCQVGIKQTGEGASDKSGIELIKSTDNDDAWRIWRSTTYLQFYRTTDGWDSYTQIAYIDPSDADIGTDLLDFTGQHRSDCMPELKNNDNIGLIVSSTGIYKNLDQQVNPKINQALPSVELSKIINDKKVYGVISSIEDENEENRLFKAGALVSTYKKNDNRLVINALGEGAIWITNINGNLENGDYITSSEIAGYGMKQDDDILHNYSVAKITQDCSFDIDNEPNYLCEEIEYNGSIYLKAFVGCTYHCG